MNVRIVKNKKAEGTTYTVYFSHTQNYKQIRKSKTFKSKSDAEKYKTLLVNKYSDDELETLVKLDTLFFADFLNLVLAAHKNKIKESTYVRYLQMAKRLSIYFDKVKFLSVTPKKIEEYYNSLFTENLKNPYNMALKINNFLNLTYTYAIKWDYCKYNPMLKVDCPRDKNKEEKIAWTTQEINIFLNSIKNEPTYYNPVYTALNTGLRLGELIGLQWKNINFFNSTIKVENQLQNKKIQSLKTNSSRRTVPMFNELKKMLWELKKDKKEDDFVFLSSVGLPFYGSDLSRGFSRRVSRCTDVRPITFHGLRHTFASQCITNLKIPIEVVSKILGHSKTSITMDIYFHLAENTALNYFADIGSFVGEKQEQKNNLAKLSKKKYAQQ